MRHDYIKSCTVYTVVQQYVCVCVCVFSFHSFWTSNSLDVPAGVTQEEGHTGFLIHLPSAVRALIFLARRIQPFLPLSTVKSNFEQQKWYQQILPEVQKLARHDYIKSCTVYTVVQQYVCVCVCVFFPFILDIKFVGRTSRGHTGGRSHRISHPPSFCGACLNFSREKDSAIPSLVDCEVEFCVLTI